MKLTTRLVHGAVFCAALIGLTSFGVTPTAVWQGNDLTDGNTKNGMTLYLNGNTSAGGVVTIGSSSVYIETGMGSSSPHAGTEATVVMTWENVKPTVYGAVATFSTASQVNAVGVECFGYNAAVKNQFYWIKDNSFSGANFYDYPNDLASHKVAFACASPTSGTGSGDYNGIALAVDGSLVNMAPSFKASGNCVTRIDLGGYTDKLQYTYYQTGARITRIAVYNSALSTEDLKTVTSEEEPEPGYDEEVLATYYGFSELTNGCYVANLNGNAVAGGDVTISAGAIKLTSTNTWTSGDAAISVLVKYSNFTQPSGDAALVTIRNSQAGTMDSGVGVCSKSDDTVRGIWQGKVWNDVTGSSIEGSGYLVFTYKGGEGTCLYDSAGTELYKAPGLMSSKSQTIGDMLTIGALGGNTLIAENTIIEGARIFKGALSADEIVAAVEDFESGMPQPEALSPMYVNRLSTGDAVVPPDTYGAIKVPGFGFKATAFDVETNLSNVASGEEIVGSYANIIRSGTYVGTHTVAGWFNVGALPTDSSLKVIYVAQSVQTDGTLVKGEHCGYKVAVDKDGKLYVGKVKSSDGTWDWQGTAYKATTASVISGNSWFHLALAATAVTSTNPKTVIPVIYVNGQVVGLDEGSFAGNLNGNKCGRVWIGADVSASGIYVDNAALATSATIVEAALTTPVAVGVPTGPVITKDEKNHTWVVDTTYGAYEFTDDDINDLKTNKWAVTIKSQSDYSATINFGSISGPQKSHFVFESGMHALVWVNGNENTSFTTDGTGEDPSILVKSGATLNFTARDITGWTGAAANKKGNVIRVNDGGTLNLLQSGTSTHYYQGRYWLDPGATLNADSYASDKFRLNGGAVEGCEQLYVPDTTTGAPAATISVANGLNLPNNATAGLGVFVGSNATLAVDAPITGAQVLTKWGAGTLALNGALTGYTGTLTVNAGTLKLPQVTTLGGSLTLAADTVVDIAYDGLPPEGTVLLTAAGGVVTNDAVVVKVNGEKCSYEIAGEVAIVFGHAEVVVPTMNFTYEPKVGASPEGWFTGFSGESFSAGGQFRVGPGGECFSVVSSGRHPYKDLESKSNYTMALYADISQLSYDLTGRYMLTLGSKNAGVNQGILMTKDGNIQLYQANKTTVQYTLTTTNAPAAGYHLFVWTQSKTNGGALYVDGVRVGTLPAMTSATSAGFQIGNMYGGVWGSNYGQAIGMAVAGVYGWGQVLSPAQVALLAEQYPAIPGGITVKSVPQSITGTLNLVYGNTITSGVYGCSIAVAYGATIDIAYDGVVEEGAKVLEATSISADAVTFTINGQPLPPELDMDTSGGRLVIGKQKVTKLLNPLAVKEGDDLKVSCNEEAPVSEAAKAYDGNLATYFNPGTAANANGVSWTGIEFTNGVIVTRIAYVSNKERRVIGGAFQGANEPDFSDATNMYVVAEYTNGGVDVTLDEAQGPYKYLRFIGMYGGDIKEIAYYGLADSGELAPTKVPTITGTSSNGVARITVTADETIPQVFIVQRAMRNFCDPDGSDYETCVTLAPQLGETMNWTDRKPTGYAMYRAKGFNANGSSEWTYFEMTPEKLINGPAAPSFKGDKPGFYEETASVEITYGDPDATIYYTTDGSTPTTNSTPYTGAITLVDVCESVTNDLVNIRPNPTQVTDSGYKWIKPTADQPNVNVIRARAFMPDGSASTNDIAGTWMVGPTANAHKLRVISIQTDRANYFSDPTGIMVPGDVYNQKGWPGGTVGSPNANYFQHGDDWERPAQIEIFDTDRSEMLSAPMGTRIRGNWSRAAAKKSLTCYFRKEYGVKNAKIKLFNDEKKMKFKRFNLRNGGNDWYKFGYRDAIGQSMFRGYVSTGTQGFEPGVLYINGEYWGLYNLRHCYSKHHFEEWSGGVGDDIDYVKMSPDDGNHFEVQEGDLCAMWNIMQYMIACTADDVMDDDEYAYVSSQIDITDMIDYYIINAFLGNDDWLSNGNNMGYWRNRHGDDQKWHFTVYDCDSAMSFGGDSYGTDHIDAALKINDENDAGTKMAPGFFKRCFKNEGFRKRFANRYADLLNTALTAERATNVVAEVAATVSHELPRNIDRWLNIGSGANWSNQLARVNKFFYRRQENVFGHIKSHCNGGSLASITLTNSVGNGTVKLNTIESGKEFELPFTGTYFANIPVTLTATPESGSEFAGWKIGDEVISTEPTLTLTPTNGVTIQAVFQAGGANPQQALRLVEIYGSTSRGSEEEGNLGDVGEFVIITNTSAQAVDLTGMVLKSEKNKSGYTTSLEITVPNGQISAHGTYKLEQSALWPTQKITNGAIRMTITDADGVEIQVGNTKFKDEADGDGASMVADNLLNPCNDWHVGPIHDPKPTPPPGPGGEYTLSGKLTNDVTFTSSSNVVVTLNNVTSENYKLTLEGAGVFTIYYPEGTTNSFTMKNNAAALIATNAAGVVITGPGVGNFKSTKKIADFGVIAAKDLTVEGGTTTVTFDQDKPTTSCIYLTGNYWQKGGTMNVVMPKVNTTNEFNGVLLYNKKTYAKIDGGAFNATVGGTKSNAIKLKGSCNGYFNGGTMTASLIGPQARVTNGGTQTFTDGSYVVTMPEDYTSLTNARVFKVDKALTISGGTFDITVPSDGSEAFATEEDLMTISGGTFRVLTGNDCVSAEVGFKMTGGTFYGTSTGNDVIDSNADIEITGGLLLAYTTAVEEDGYGSLGLDVNIGHTLTISGGTVVALGGPNAKWPDGCDFQQPGYTNVELDASAYSEKYLVLECEKTKTTARLPKITKQTFALLVSAPTLKGPATTTETEPKVAPVAEGIPAWVESVGDDIISGDYPDGTNIVLTADATIKIGNATFGKALTITGGNPTIEMQPDAWAFIPTIDAGANALTINGAGTLMMTNSTTLIVCGDLIVTNGTMDLIFDSQTAKDKAIVLTGDFKQYGGAISLTLASDVQLFGIYSNTKDKMAYVYGGTFDAVVAGGEKSAAIKMNKGSSDITIEGGKITATMSGVAPRFANTDGNIKIKGGTIEVSTAEGLGANANVFSAKKGLKISGGVITGEATGEGSEVFSADEAIEIKDGVISVESADDCFSAASIAITGGKVQGLSTGGDAIDAKTDVTIEGGYVFATTCFTNGYGIAADGKFVVSGGNVVAVGAPGFIRAPDEGSIACYTNASIAKLKKYLELTSDYIDHTEKLSVNLKEGEKRCKDGLSLVAVVPNMYGTYTDTKDKPTDVDPKHAKKLDPNLDGVFVTTIEKTTPSIVPGSTSASYDTEEAATNMAAQTTVSRPAEVAQSGAITEEAYANLFDVTVVQTATSTWELAPELKPTVSNDVQTAANAAVTSETLVGTMTTAEPTAKVKTQAGLFYGLAASEALNEVGTVGIPFAKWVLGAGGEQQLKADKPGEGSGFYQIRVQIAPPKP